MFDADGAYLRTLPIKGPFLAVDDAGSVYNVDESTRTLERSDPDGAVTAIATLEALLPFATGIGLLSSGGITASRARRPARWLSGLATSWSSTPTAT